MITWNTSLGLLTSGELISQTLYSLHPRGREATQNLGALGNES